MKLKVLLPFQVYAEVEDVGRIVAETPEGAFGILPHRLDCTAILSAGILTYEVEGSGEVYVAVNEGVLVKAGDEVLVSVRNAVGGEDLGRLRETVEREFAHLDAGEREVRAVLLKLESGFMRRLAEFRHG